ncbi:hypothetical protein J3R83DRAFT_3240 [Lanmaoa asiatica]|nr:hypothetical protein J3R83DRAFT_4670 [Lanmaoa asiatica]KAH0828794.1 hypothetical protein J3R83DRAFT_3240 [Lanmaoa asiatica]
MPLSVLTTGEEWSKLAPTLAQDLKQKCKTRVIYESSDEEGPSQVAEKQKKAPKRRKTRK